MTAGTVVITGGILATVILLCIIAVLCYCRLQYYCCRRHGSDGEGASASDGQPQFACNACSALAMDGSAVTPLTLPFDPSPPHSYCPTCSPYYPRGRPDEACNGGERLVGERLGFVPTVPTVPTVAAYYENPGASTALGMSVHTTPLTARRPAGEFYTNTRAFSTDV